MVNIVNYSKSTYIIYHLDCEVILKDKKLLGDIGEKMATSILYAQGYEILETNFRCVKGEIDIICRKDMEIGFVEVKTRSGIEFGTPGEAVTLLKQNKIRSAATLYLQKTQMEYEKTNFIVLEIIINKIEYAF